MKQKQTALLVCVCYVGFLCVCRRLREYEYGPFSDAIKCYDHDHFSASFNFSFNIDAGQPDGVVLL